MPSSPTQDTLLCVCNYPSNTGYAWDFIEGLYAEIARRLAARGIRTLVAYPKIVDPPRTLADCPAVAVELDATLQSFKSIRDTVAFVRRERVSTVYLTDQPARSLGYAAARLAGVRHVVVHDHASGARSIPRGVRRTVKWALGRSPLIVADVVFAVSDFVARRQVDSALIPADRVVRVWNGIPVPPQAEGRPLHEALGLDPTRPAVACACRCAPEKGVPTLLRAFDRLMADRGGRAPRPVLVYMGEGPQFAEVQRLRETLPAREDIVLTGYRRDAGALIAGADVCAMPSLWQDALPLAVMQPMALSRPVVGSAVGGIPEMIVDGETGLLVPPGDDAALAAALGQLVDDPARCERFGRAGRERVATLFTQEGQMQALTSVLLDGFGRR
ncbi:MAG: glycosyltransferase family 4 protein [Vicinamibacteria bacterium]